MTQDLNSPRDPFRLARLPQLEPVIDSWPQIESALRQHQMVRRTTAWLASAAVITLAFGFYWQLPRIQPVDDLNPSTAGVNRVSATTANNNGSLGALVKLSQTLEQNLRAMRAETGAVPEQSLIYQVELEDLVSQVDEAINLHPDSRELWSQRVNLLLDLNQLYGQQLRRDYHQIASL